MADLETRCRELLAKRLTLRSFPIRKFKDGENIGLPKWAENLVIGGYAEQGWAAFDQLRGGERVAGGKWGDKIILAKDGSIVGEEDLRQARTILADTQ